MARRGNSRSPIWSGRIASRTRVNAAGNNRSVSFTTARVRINLACTPSSFRSIPDSSSASQLCVCSDPASNTQAQNSVTAVVSWPARISVAIWSRSSAGENPAPVSGSRALVSRSKRSRGLSPGLGVAERCCIIVSIRCIQRLLKRARAQSRIVGIEGGSNMSSRCGRANVSPNSVSNARIAPPCCLVSSENIERPAISKASVCMNANRSLLIRRFVQASSASRADAAM